MRIFFVRILLFTLFLILQTSSKDSPHLSKQLCLSLTNTLRARHKTCFLRPDTGPCRADIVQWYFDAKQGKCYRFFWGGCQGNGNRFQSKEACGEHCWINSSSVIRKKPYFCDLAFDFGTCFGHYERWSYDSLYRTCKRHIYSGCGGNQNNFETINECNNNCLRPPNNTLVNNQQFTTCIPLNLPDLNRRRRRRRRR